MNRCRTTATATIKRRGNGPQLQLNEFDNGRWRGNEVRSYNTESARYDARYIKQSITKREAQWRKSGYRLQEEDECVQTQQQEDHGRIFAFSGGTTNPLMDRQAPSDQNKVRCRVSK